MPQALPANDFLPATQQPNAAPLLDIRSPGEYEKGHIPGAISFPLFDNEERAIVGTLYKQQGHDDAVRAGLEIIGPKLAKFVAAADKLTANRETRELYIYCWRGGMRSGSMAWLLETAGFDVKLLKGGYKAFRGEARRALANDHQFLILGGYTGSAKTKILQLMAERDAQVIDLEGIANHKGSAFGNLRDKPQPSSEHFTNMAWQALQGMDSQRPVWLEDESRHIGAVWLDLEFAQRIEQGPVVAIERSRQERAEFLATDYGDLPTELLMQGFAKIQRKLGGAGVNEAHSAVNAGDLKTASELALGYYDKTYEYGLGKRQAATIHRLDVVGWDNSRIADYLIDNQQQWLSAAK